MEQELRNKISLAMKEDFVGNYVFTDEELTSIYNDAGFVLRRIGGEWGADLSRMDFELIFVALVNLAKEWNSDEDAFFDFIYRRLLGSMFGGGKIYNQIVRVIKSLSTSGKIFMLDCYTKKYYATLCSHSFAPISSTESFFDMCWEIYCKDLDQQYGKNDPAFKLIANSLNKKFSSYGTDEEDFQIGSKVYSFRAGIRGLAIDHIDLMTRLLDETMETIHSLFNNEPLKLEKHITRMINSWWKKKESTFGIERRRGRISKEHICTDYSQIRPKYILEDGVAKLVIPSIRLIDNYDYDPYIEVKVNGNRVICDRMSTRGSGIIMSTTAIEYDLSSFEFDSELDINIEITHRDRVIYNSKDSLKREFILFRNSREVLSLDCVPGLYFLYVKNIDKLLRYPEDIHRTAIDTYSLEAFDGEAIQSDNKSVFFMSEKTNRDLYFFAKEHNNAIYRRGNEEYKVIDGELYIDVSENTDIKDLGVRYESVVFRLSDFDNEIVNGKKRYMVSALLNVGETQHISIFRYSDNIVVASINLIKFNNIRISFDKPLYYGKGVIGTAKFLTEKYDVEAQFDIKNSEISLPLEDGEVILYPPILRWKIDDGEWHTEENSKGMWYKEMTNSSIVTFDVPKAMRCLVGLDTNAVIEQSGTGFSYKIGQTIYSLKENGNHPRDYFTFFVRVENEFYLVSDIYCRECFTDEPVFIMSKMNQAFWLPETFIGDNDAKLRFDVIDQSSRCVFTKELTLDKQSFILTNVEDGYYTYKISLLVRGFLKTEKELCSHKFILGDEKSIKYKGKTILIRKVSLFDKLEPEVVRPIYIDSIKYLGNKDNYDFYSGMLFIIDREGRKTYLNSMKNEFNNYVKINPVRIEIKNECSCYLGYGLDPNDEEFEFDDEFTLDNQGRTTIGSRSFGQRTRGIDYFLFEVRKNV